ncbi:hypothetical protein LJC61_09195 [Ruminococcaceae bacterium OttesenSCG-928-A16]|nr:hypothetical protein [Ruminococcaceae bacterium OttesenSCG-928-A16]
MKKLTLRPVKNKDITLLWLLAAGVLLLVAKLIFSSAQNVFLWPEEALLDDMMMYNAAVSITKGQWLGAYSSVTLSKHSFFALWLAVLHWLRIPMLAGGQLLWGAASLAGAWAVLPVLKKRWAALLLYAVLLFSPATLANPSPIGFVTRVYRDNIFPALCLLCVAGMVGFALRYKQKLSHSVGWLVLAGLGFAACWLTREDGWWLLPFVAVATVVIFVFIVRDNTKGRIKRALALCLPFVLLLAGTLAWRSANYAVYGRFIISDFSSGEFADAYGAMTRVKAEDPEDKAAVPYEVRRKLYDLVPAFAELEPLLESPAYLELYGNHNAGGFYWALREAAAAQGYYDTPQKAQAYFAGLAADINALCDAGVLPAGAKRSSVSPAIRARYIAPVSKEAMHSLVFCATFQQCSPRSLFSPGGNDPAFYAEKLQPMEEFLHEKAIIITHENTTDPVYTQFQNIAYKLLDIIQIVYSVLLPLALCAALVWQVVGGVQLAKRLRARQKAPGQTLGWVIQLGVLFCFVLRAFMVAFVSVTSFEIGTYIMYLASIHPLMLLYGFCGTAGLAQFVWHKRRSTKEAKA